MTNIEFFHNGKGDTVFAHSLTSGKVAELTPALSELINDLYYTIQERYPKAFEMLLNSFPKQANLHKFLVVRRFLACNFFINDAQADIDINGNYHLEDVPCPLKACVDCSGYKVICLPELNTQLSNRELEVARLLASGMTKNDVADKLFVSPHTVDKHRCSIYTKLGIHKEQELASYLLINKLI